MGFLKLAGSTMAIAALVGPVLGCDSSDSDNKAGGSSTAGTGQGGQGGLLDAGAGGANAGAGGVAGSSGGAAGSSAGAGGAAGVSGGGGSGGVGNYAPPASCVDQGATAIDFQCDPLTNEPCAATDICTPLQGDDGGVVYKCYTPTGRTEVGEGEVCYPGSFYCKATYGCDNDTDRCLKRCCSAADCTGSKPTCKPLTSSELANTTYGYCN